MAASPRDQGVGGDPGVDVHGGGVQRPGADLVVGPLHADLGRRQRDQRDVAVLAGRVVVDAARHHHDVIGDGGQRDELLDPADIETPVPRGDLGLDDLQVGAAGLLGGSDAQHGLPPDRPFADVPQVVGLAEPAQDGDRRVVQADPHPDAGRGQPAQGEGELDQLADVGQRAVAPFFAEDTARTEVFDQFTRKLLARFGFRRPRQDLFVERVGQQATVAVEARRGCLRHCRHLIHRL